MSNINLEQSICKAIEIIADKKISQASYDVTITGYVKKVLDLTNGKYLIQYEDNQFQAYTSSANLCPKEGQQVSVLIPGNDWSRTKTIVGAIQAYAANFNDIQDSQNKFNQIGKNVIGEGMFSISSYISETLVLFDIENENNNKIIVDQEAAKEFIQRGDGLNLSAVIQTSFDTFQTGGWYGVIFDLEFLDDKTKTAAVHQYTVSSLDLYGNPYTVLKPTKIQKTYNEVETKNFNRVTKITLFADGFNEDKEKGEIRDITFSNISLVGAEVLSEQKLNGYTLHINYGKSLNGNKIINKTTEEKNKVIFQAELKSNGNIITDNVEYYWFRENALVFANSDKYCSKGGEGWECLNNFTDNGVVIPAFNQIQFVGSQEQVEKCYIYTLMQSDSYSTNTDPLTVFVPQKRTKIKCVAVKGLIEQEGYEEVINQNVLDIYIDSSDKIGGTDQNRVDYYRDSGSPTLTCKIVDPNSQEENKEISPYTENEDGTRTYQYKFNWSIITNRGESTPILSLPINNNPEETETKSTIESNTQLRNRHWRLQDRYNRADESTKQQIEKNAVYTNTEQEYQDNIETSRVEEEIYYYFPIKDIYESSRIVCTVQEIKRTIDEDGNELQSFVYIGTASITLYNHMQLQDTYSLIIENNSQVFHYDSKGTSPASNQIQKPITILPLTFKLFDNQGNEISYQQIINNGYVEWLIPNKDTLLIADTEKNGLPITGLGEISMLLLKGDDKALAADFDIYKNGTDILEEEYKNDLSSFFFSIAPSFDQKKNKNYIRLDIKYNDMLFSAYTNFSFPKQGDPGTNGTDLFARLVPIDNSNAELSGRVYAETKQDVKIKQGVEIKFASTIGFVNEEGYSVKGFKFLLYDNGNLIENLNDNIHWTCPPEIHQNNSSTHLRSENSLFDIQIRSTQDGNLIKEYGDLSFKNFTNTRNATWSFPTQISNIREYLPIDIVRGQYGDNPNNIKYFAEYPVCYCHVKNTKYRIKLKPKSGFDYVVYKDDGTSPDYDNTLPFEIIVQKLEELDGNNTSQYYFNMQPDDFQCVWHRIGTQLEIQDGFEGNPKFIKPKDLGFNSAILYNAIVVGVYTKDAQLKDNQGKYTNPNIGFIHIPIYMITNRYGHGALNSWDGSSIELGRKEIGKDAQGNPIYEPTGTILAPQVGAGKKDPSTNTFTGILMGQEKTSEQYDKYNPQETKVGLFGYYKGERSIFLDAQSGKAQFGKSGKSRITLDPSLKMQVDRPGSTGNQHPKEDAAFIYSGNFRTLQQDNTYKEEPEKFDLTQDGQSYITRQGKLHKYRKKDNELIQLREYYNYQKQPNNGGMIIDLTSPQLAFANGKFNVSKDGEMHAQYGNIGGWKIDVNTLYNQGTDPQLGLSSTNPDNVPERYVGMNSNPANSYVTEQLKNSNANNNFLRVIKTQDNNLPSNTVDLGNMAFWCGSGGGFEKNFFVTHKGFLYSKSGKIANWNIGQDELYNEYIQYSIKRNAEGKIIYKDKNGKNTTDPTKGVNIVYIDKDGKDTINLNEAAKISDTLTGMNGNPNHTSIAGAPQNGGTKAKAFYAYNRLKSSEEVFYVTHDGFLRSTAGQIATWKIDSKKLSNNTVGMGDVTFPKTVSYYKYEKDTKMKTFQNPFKEDIVARFFAGEEDKDLKESLLDNNYFDNNRKPVIVSDPSKLNFAVSSTGRLFSKSGRIGGWKIDTNTLESWKGSIELYAGGNDEIDNDPESETIKNKRYDYCDGLATGWIRGRNSKNEVTWQISNNGSAFFSQGKIAGWTITDDRLKGGNTYIKKDGSMGKIVDGSHIWHIQADGDAYFRYIHGRIASTSGEGDYGSASLIGGGGGSSSPGYKFNSDGSFTAGAGTGQNLSYNGSDFKLGCWTINEDGQLYAKDITTGLILRDTSITAQNGGNNTTGSNYSFFCSSYVAAPLFKAKGFPGASGTITFSDGATINVHGGLITAVNPGTKVTWKKQD